MAFLEGYKTYIAGFGLIAVAVVGALLHFADPANAMAMPLDVALTKLLEGLGLVGLRKAVTK